MKQIPMTAPEKLMQKLIHMATGELLESPVAIRVKLEARYDYGLEDAFSDAEGELRRGEENTGLYSEGSRHYESRAVAAQMLDGSWVGWTYWYGGGKHGEPGSIPWIEDAYDVTFVEQLVKVKQFHKAEEK